MRCRCWRRATTSRSSTRFRCTSSRQSSPGVEHAQLRDAGALPFSRAAFDAVLLLGPLYHLPERRERIRALRAAARVVRSDGVVCAAVISRYASTFDGLYAGCPVVDLYAIEGPASNLAGIDGWLDDEKRCAALLRAIRRVEQDPTLVGGSSHLCVSASPGATGIE